MKRQSNWLAPLMILALAGSASLVQAAEPGTPASPYPPGAASPAPTAAPETQPPQMFTGASAGYIFIAGKQAFYLGSVAGYPVDKRFEDIKNRIRAVIQPSDSNTALKVSPEDVTIRFEGSQPVVYLKNSAIVTVTNEDADAARTDPLILANQWANELRNVITNYQVGESLPETWIEFKVGAPPVRAAVKPTGQKVLTSVGGITYNVKNGVVTLKGTVESNFQRSQAELAVRRIPGVVQVNNQIMVRPKVKIQPAKTSDTELRRQIEQQLQDVIR